MYVRSTGKIIARELLLSFVYTTIWFVILFAVSYPVDQWVGIVVIAYVSLCLSRVLIANLAVFLLTRLHEYGSQVAARMGIERSDPTDNRASRAAASLFLFGVLAAIFGLTLTITGAWASYAGLWPLGRVFDLAGWAMLSVGSCMTALFFLGSYLLFKGGEVLSDKLSSRVNAIEQSKALVGSWSANPAALSAPR